MPGLRIGAALVFLSGVGCSLLLSTAEPVQCRSQRDCDANPALRDRVCNDGFCVLPQEDPGHVSEPTEACTSTEHCTALNGGKASICKNAGGTCTPLETGRCGAVRGAWDDAHPIFIGTILPFHHKQVAGPAATDEYAAQLARAIDLGLEELNAALPDGLPIVGAPRGRFAVVHCDSYLDPDGAREAMKHLTDVVRAKAVIVGSDHDLQAVRTEALTSGTAVVCSDCIEPFAPGPFAWRIVPTLAHEAPMAAWRVGELEKEIKARPSAPAQLKVAVLSAPDPAATAFVSALSEKLVFNGKRALDNDAAFLTRTAENPQNTPVLHQAHAEAIVSFEPDVVVVAMGDDFPYHYLPLIETLWPPAQPKPHYVMTALSSNAAPFASLIGSSDDDLRRRLSGTRPVTDPIVEDDIASYESRYMSRFNKRADGNFSGYDAFYATAYAIAGAAVSAPVLDGPHIDAAFGRLGSGPTIEVGLPKLGTALKLLGAPGASIDLHGLVTPLDWDVTTRDLTMMPTGLYCFERDGTGSLVLRLNAGPRMNPSTGEVDGVYACN